MDTTPFQRARLHRFCDTVALSLPSMPTVYLSAALAESLAGALADYAKDVRSCAFHVSRIGTTDVGTDCPDGMRCRHCGALCADPEALSAHFDREHDNAEDS